MNGLDIKKIVQFLPFILIVTSIAGLLFGGFSLSRWDYSIRGLIIAIPFIIAAILLNPIFKLDLSLENCYIKNKLNPRMTLIFFSILYAISILFLALKIDRIWYLLIIVGLYIIVMIQIFAKNQSIHKMLCEICLIMVNVIYGVTFSYPLYFRTTDVMGHIYLATVTYLSGHVIPLDIDVSYSAFPVYHIFIAECSNLLNLPIQETLFLVTCPVYVIVVLFLYKLFEKFSNNSQVSLLACLFYSISNVILSRGIEMVTSPMAYIGFVILLYLIYKGGESEKHKYDFQILALVTVVFILFVHQVSILQFALLLIILMILEYFFAEKRYNSMTFIQFIVVLFLAYWTFYAIKFLEWFSGPRLDVNFIDLGTKHTTVHDLTLDQNSLAFLYLYNNIETVVIIAFTMVGIGYMLWKQKPNYLIVIGLFSLVSLPLYIPSPLITSETFAILFRIDRFQILISPFIAFAMAYGLIVLINLIQKKPHFIKLSYSVIGLTLLILMFSSLSNVILTESQTNKLYFNSEELQGFKFIISSVPYGSYLQSDYFTARYFIQKYSSLSDELGIPYYNSLILRTIEMGNGNDEYTIVREKAFRERGLSIGEGYSMENYPPSKNNIFKLTNYENYGNKIYFNNDISIIL